ncbi:type II secretion system protein GspE [candidate division GN15 bacterium]|nr:type II secretion system protein GspE [candidate division GN15 bacterium]
MSGEQHAAIVSPDLPCLIPTFQAQEPDRRLKPRPDSADNIMSRHKLRKELNMLRKKLGELLIERGMITEEQLSEALQHQARTGRRLGTVLTELGYVSEDEMVDVVSDRLGIPRVTLNAMVIDPQVIQRLSVETARRYTLIPIFAIGNTLTLAMADPLNIIAIDEIKYQTGCDIKRAIASETEIRDAIEEYYSVADSLQEIVSTHSAQEAAAVDAVAASDSVDEADSPIIKLVNLIINKAIRDRASDVHIEPDEKSVRIRYRVSGVMREEASPPKSMQNEVISRIKIAANLDVSEKRLPQDGRFLINTESGPVDLRISTLPTIHGEKIVIRILDRRNLFLTLRQLGLEESLEQVWLDLINKPEGLILLSGPTSSGKTSTLYTSLQQINSVEKNIVTVEDPVEYSLPLINQVQINEKAGLNFPSTLRSILRQNPDVIMIGEIRDRETAQMAVRSALTGHLVFSTIHTNDAPSAITRLLDMGIEDYLVATALKGVLAQRLVRQNCPACTEEYLPSPAVLSRANLPPDIAATITFKRGAGCNQCKMTGFQNQVGIFELIRITPTISEMMLSGVSLGRIREQALQSGYQPLFDAGLDKVRSGTICLEELLKETSNIEDIPAVASADPVRFANADTPV